MNHRCAELNKVSNICYFLLSKMAPGASSRAPRIRSGFDPTGHLLAFYEMNAAVVKDDISPDSWIMLAQLVRCAELGLCSVVTHPSLLSPLRSSQSLVLYRMLASQGGS